MSSLAKTLAAGVGLVLAMAPGWALGQEDPPFVPPNETVDRNLDEALHEEYSGKADQRPQPIPDHAAKDQDKDERFRIRLRLMGSYWHAQLTDLELYSREGTSGGEKIKIEDPYDIDLDDSNKDLEGDPAGFYSVSLDLGRYVAIRGGFSHVTLIDNAFQVGAPGGLSSFTFGQTTWSNGDRLDLSHEIFTGDFDLVLRPLNNKVVTIDISIGARYMYWDMELKRNQAAVPNESERLEAVVPTVGLGLAIRPVEPLELFASARVGHLSYEVDEGWEWDEWKDEWDYQERRERESTSLQIEVGISVTIADTLGFIAGYRYDKIAMELDTDAASKGFEGSTHGLFGGLIIQFSD